MNKVIWTNGTFDILHFGHFKLLEYAKSFGDYLVVGIDADSRVREKKGDSRPIHNVHQRKFNLHSIKYVDAVVVFSSDEQLRKLIIEWSPKVMVIGDEYKDKKVIGSEYAKKLIFFDMPRVVSSTEIINKL
jgi:D-beta-D-heptose 7-phosphate kinase/D-beta-D-heptose 1-phosphate adenosyltransferase